MIDKILSYSLLKGGVPIDKNTFKWQRTTPFLATPPIVAQIDGSLYCLSNFKSQTDEYLVTKLSNFYEALDLSLELAGNKLGIVDLGFLYNICLQLDLDQDRFPVFKYSGIKGNKNFEVLKTVIHLPEALLDYLETKNIPMKTVGLVAGFNKTVQAFICDYVTKINPSWQNFKKMVELVADFKDSVTTVEYSENWNIPDVKSVERKDIEEELKKLQKKIAPCRIFTVDDFETGRFTFSAELSDMEDYRKANKLLDALGKDIAQFFDLLKKYDIR